MKTGFFPLRVLLIGLVLMIPGLSGEQLSAQALVPETTGENTDSTVVTPIPAIEISSEYDNSVNLISTIGRLRITDDQVKELEMRIDSIYTLVDKFLEDSILTSLNATNIRELDHANSLVEIQIDQIDDLQSQLTSRTKEIEKAMLDLAHVEMRWQLTRDQADEKNIPSALQLRISNIISQIDSTNKVLREDFNTLLVGESALSSRNNQLKALEDSIYTWKDELGKNIFGKDMPPFFEDLANLEDTVLLHHHKNELTRAFQSDAKLIKTKFKAQVWLIVFLTLAILLYALWFKKNYKKLADWDQFELNSIQLSLLQHPVATGLFVVMIVVRFFFDELADSLQGINLFILMVPMIIIVLRRQSEKASPWIEWLIVFYFATYFYQLYYYPDILQRIMLMILSMGGSLYFFLVLYKRTVIIGVKNKTVFNLLRITLWIFALMCFAAIFWNLGGAFRMAEYFTLAFMQITMLVLAIYVAAQVLNALVFLILISSALQRLNVIKDFHQQIHKKVSRFINLLLWITFFLGTLRLLSYKDKFLAWGSGALHSGWKIGAVDITPASILIFIFVIWLSVFISKVLTNILDKDVFTRVTTSKGMPNTITMLLKIFLISGGFFLAAAAAGMHLSNLSIIIGAFSVGIGFGLQNIFNNMVSGLILAFERPIKVGDTVQLTDLMGEVESIGFRASTIRSFDGSEVIVPNGNLISNSMINWTLKDYLRRMDIRVGVAYGTDPEAVLEILKEIAGEHAQVRKKPAPSAFFIGFGDSSLDFRLLAWTNIDRRLTVESELNVSINKKLAEAGIEIPFPQRDLHIRSDATKA